MNRIAGTIVPFARCGIPQTNPTRPSPPTDFRATIANGLATFEWGQPAVVPVGTHYSLYSAPFTVAHPDSMSLIFEGDALAKTIQFSTSNPLWFWVQARANSGESALVPGSFGLGLNVVIPPVYVPASGTWGASIAPSGVTKTGATNQLTTAAAYVTVLGSAAPVFAWTNPSSINIRINSPAAPITTFTGSGLSLGEQRLGTFWCGITDGANVTSKSVSVSVYRPDNA